MAAEAPDPKTFGSWEDAFQYPIATVRGMERQLRNDIESNREKLRSLVGASYRDLLGTADSIVKMDGQMQKVEAYLAKMGMRCNNRLLEKKAANLRAWDNDVKSKARERYAFASQLAVLRSCPEAISRLLKRGGSVLLAAKALVISRLTYKKLSQSTDPPPYLEVLRNRLATLRRKLLARIDGRFKSLDSSESALVEAMCASCLVTSSSPTDILRHFHHVRQSTISELGQKHGDNEGIFKSFILVVQTIRDCQAIFPRQLARALEDLKRIPLLQASDLQTLQGLSLDVHQRWLGEDINSFVPYVRHDDLQKPEASKIMKQWAKQAFTSFLRDLGKKANSIEDPAVIVHLRQEMLSLCFSSHRHSAGVNTIEVLDGIRNAFNYRFKDLIHRDSADLSKVASIIETLLEDWESSVSDACPSLWSDASTSTNTASGGKALREALSIRAFGRTEPVRTVSAAYTAWLDSIRDLEIVIKEMEEKRWAEDVDSIDEDDDILEKRQLQLKEDDPRLLRETLKDDLRQNFQKLRETMQYRAQFLGKDDYDDTSSQKAVFLLRVWREITNQLPSTYSNSKSEADFITLLHVQVSRHALFEPLTRCRQRITRALHHNRLQARVLWEGDQQLPVLPSPLAFRFLHDLVKAMTGCGVDIWTPQATRVLKHQVREALAPLMGKLPEEGAQVNGYSGKDREVKDEDGSPESPKDASPQTAENGNNQEEKKDASQQAEEAQIPNGNISSAQPGPTKEVVRDIEIQRLFDLLYLGNALRVEVPPSSQDEFDSVQSNIMKSLELPNRHVERLRTDAEGYWKRTELLFALVK
ncbi:MAG: hypothetical protein Q9201_006576 [Fulgogasparrea decipioides]